MAAFAYLIRILIQNPLLEAAQENYVNFYTGHLRLFFLAIALVASVTAQAQSSDYDPPNRKTEVFGGFSTVGLKPGHVDAQDYSSIRLNGWTASYTTYQFFRRWGLTAEFSGNYGSPTIDSPAADGVAAFALRSRNHTYLFGGTYRSFERRRIALTGRILAGATHWSPTAVEVAFPSPAVLGAAGVYEPQTAFTIGFGQSVDWKLSEAVGIRIQPDLRVVRIKDTGGDHRMNLQLPFSIGLVYKFGDRQPDSRLCVLPTEPEGVIPLIPVADWRFGPKGWKSLSYLR